MRFVVYAVLYAAMVLIAALGSAFASVRPISPIERDNKGNADQDNPSIPCIIQAKPAVIRWIVTYPDGKRKIAGQVEIKRGCVR